MIFYKDAKERKLILEENVDKQLIEDAITLDGNYLIFSSDMTKTEPTKEEVLEQEIIDLKARVLQLESATQTKEV